MATRLYIKLSYTPISNMLGRAMFMRETKKQFFGFLTYTKMILSFKFNMTSCNKKKNSESLLFFLFKFLDLRTDKLPGRSIYCCCCIYIRVYKWWRSWGRGRGGERSCWWEALKRNQIIAYMEKYSDSIYFNCNCCRH